jgi:hypothetical protein
MYVTIGGKKYRLTWARMKADDGTCDPPTQRGKRITIDPRVRRDSRKYMETVLHELLHAAVWSLDEEYVRTYAHDAARILHRLGFGLKEGDSNGA